MHLITLFDWAPDEVRELIRLGHELKRRAGDRESQRVLERRTLALVFEKASMRTRVSFEVAMTELGGHVTYLSKADVNLGVREPIRDGARVLSRYVDGIAARVYAHASIEELAAYSDVPVINALSDTAHPCQALADLLTIEERFGGDFEGKVAFIGDANNVSRSLATVCAQAGLDFAIASPAGYSLPDRFLGRLRELAEETGAEIRAVESPQEAAQGARVLYTDVWTSMGQTDQAEQRKRDFAGYRIDRALLKLADEDAVVMHPLPAHRGEEITDEVIEGPRSMVFDQAENRLHAARAVVHVLLGSTRVPSQ
ncbi:MAG: ornithine carbamoyltransferase [Planctomycetota bacterium]